MTHGTRTRYQQGCSCTPCRAAEAGYRANLRRLKARGLTPPGTLVNAVQPWYLLKILKPDYGSYGALAQALGRQSKQAQFNRRQMRASTAQQITLFYQRVTEGEDYYGSAHI